MSTISRNRAVAAYHDAQYFRLQELAKVARSIVEDEIKDAGIYAHQVAARVKTRESFVLKAATLLPDGTPKYTDPITQITDLIGVRVVVSIAADVPAMAKPIRGAFEVIEEIDRGNEPDVDRPGYQSLHLVVRLKPETLRAVDQPMLGTDIAIEVQIRSILQDALASFEHDLAYKAERAPTAATRRRLIELASLLQVADRLFGQVRNDALAEVELADAAPQPSSASTDTGGWTDTALENLIQEVVGETEADQLPWLRELRKVLEGLGYLDLQDFEQIKHQLTGGPLLARQLRQDQPWLTATQILDLLLRSELGDKYFMERVSTTDPEEARKDRDAFERQKQLTLRIRGGTA